MQQHDACDELLSDQAGSLQGNTAGKQSLSIVVASGPFSSKNDVQYEPLQAVLDHCSERPPQVLVLLGPFVDAQHPAVQAGMLQDSFDDIFAGQVENWVHCCKVPPKCMHIWLLHEFISASKHAWLPLSAPSLMQARQTLTTFQAIRVQSDISVTAVAGWHKMLARASQLSSTYGSVHDTVVDAAHQIRLQLPLGCQGMHVSKAANAHAVWQCV